MLFFRFAIVLLADFGCARTNRVHVVANLCAALGPEWSFVFATEFLELNEGGCHGNGILTRGKIRAAGAEQVEFFYVNGKIFNKTNHNHFAF